MSHQDQLIEKEEQRVMRRRKKTTPQMKVSGRGMKRFASPARKNKTNHLKDD